MSFFVNRNATLSLKNTWTDSFVNMNILAYFVRQNWLTETIRYFYEPDIRFLFKVFVKA